MLGQELEVVVVDVHAADHLDLPQLLVRHVLEAEVLVAPAADAEREVVLPYLGCDADMVLSLARDAVQNLRRVQRVDLALEVLRHEHHRADRYQREDEYAQRA